MGERAVKGHDTRSLERIRGEIIQKGFGMHFRAVRIGAQESAGHVVLSLPMFYKFKIPSLQQVITQYQTCSFVSFLFLSAFKVRLCPTLRPISRGICGSEQIRTLSMQVCTWQVQHGCMLEGLKRSAHADVS